MQRSRPHRSSFRREDPSVPASSTGRPCGLLAAEEIPENEPDPELDAKPPVDNEPEEPPPCRLVLEPPEPEPDRGRPAPPLCCAAALPRGGVNQASIARSTSRAAAPSISCIARLNVAAQSRATQQFSGFTPSCFASKGEVKSVRESTWAESKDVLSISTWLSARAFENS